jgi:transposase InsO family protein
MSTQLTRELTLHAFTMALGRRRPPPGLLHHSDRGSQYASGDYRRALRRAFKDEKVLQAEGDALAFTLREQEYRGAPDLTRFRLHLEALEEILPASQKILRPGDADVKDFDLSLLQPFGGKKGQ